MGGSPIPKRHAETYREEVEGMTRKDREKEIAEMKLRLTTFKQVHEERGEDEDEPMGGV